MVGRWQRDRRGASRARRQLHARDHRHGHRRVARRRSRTVADLVAGVASERALCHLHERRDRHSHPRAGQCEWTRACAVAAGAGGERNLHAGSLAVRAAACGRRASRRWVSRRRHRRNHARDASTHRIGRAARRASHRARSAGAGRLSPLLGVAKRAASLLVSRAREGAEWRIASRRDHQRTRRHRPARV